jgi:hypothetical protein
MFAAIYSLVNLFGSMVGSALAQRSERRSDLGSEGFRLFPRREVTAFTNFVKVDELAITPELVGRDVDRTEAVMFNTSSSHG